MKTIVVVVPFVMFAAGVLAASEGPKNFAAPTYRAPEVQASHELTKRDIRKLTKTAETAADHRRIAQFYRSEANWLDALGTAYEKAAASYRTGPQVKNLGSPATAARWEFAARGFHKDSEADHALADSHEQMSRSAAGF